MGSLILSIIEQLKDLHQGKPWIGPSMQKHLSKVGENRYFIQPLPELHSIAQLVNHLTVWRKATLTKIETGSAPSIDASNENWLSNDVLKKIGWETLKHEYDTSLKELIEILSKKKDAFLNETYYDPDFKDHYPYKWLLHGMVQHDAYHLGQIGITCKFINKATIQ